MSDECEDEDDPKPQDSKCWTCKHGMSLYDKEKQVFFKPDIISGNGFENEPDQPGVTEVGFIMKKPRSLCFWRPENSSPNISPIILNVVIECSRYENKNA